METIKFSFISSLKELKYFCYTINIICNYVFKKKKF